jgi:putative protease
MAEGERIGEVTHYFNKINVAVIQLEKPLQKGDRLHFLGAHTDFPQVIDSIQVEHEDVDEVAKGGEAAVKVDKRVRRGDSVFRLLE